MPPRVVIDTNVLYAALRSRDGASFQILEAVWEERLTLLLSHTLLTEYEEILKRNASSICLLPGEIGPFLDALANIAEKCFINYFIAYATDDPDDVALLRLAASGRADYLVTHNIRHFAAAAGEVSFKLLAPREFLAIIKR